MQGSFCLKGWKMGVSYEIGIMAGKNAAKEISAFFDLGDVKDKWSEVERKTLSDGFTMYRTWINNHPSWYLVGKKFLEVIKNLADTDNEDDAYRVVMVSEEGYTEEYSNTIGQEVFEDFTSSNEINYPESFADSTDYDAEAVNEEIQNIAAKCDMDTSAEKLAELLMGDENSTRKMFEELASAYHDGSADFRKGMDRALSIVTGWDLLSIAKQIEAAEEPVEV